MSISDDDKKLFKEATQGADRIYSKKVRHLQKRPTFKNKSPVEHTKMPDLPFSITYESETVSATEKLEYQKAGVQPKTLKQLRQGKIKPEASLDLHGYDVESAADELMNFINWACDEHIRCVCIVHGKGYGGSVDQPTLKNKINSWLQQIPQVIAFCSAPKHMGSTGAVLVLLKKLRDDCT